MKDSREIEIRQIQRDCLERRLEVRAAVEAIDRAIGGITRVDFQEGFKFRVTNHTASFKLEMHGIRRREEDRLYGMAVVAYCRAQQNGSTFPGEVHISEQASTKHHREGIYALMHKYAA